MQRIGPLAGYVVHLIPKRPEPDSRRELSVTDPHYTASAGKLEICICILTSRRSGIPGLSADINWPPSRPAERPAGLARRYNGCLPLESPLIGHEWAKFRARWLEARGALGTRSTRTILVQSTKPRLRDHLRRKAVSYIQITDIAVSYISQPRRQSLARFPLKENCKDL